MSGCYERVAVLEFLALGWPLSAEDLAYVRTLLLVFVDTNVLMKIAMLRRYAIICAGAMLLIACDALTAAPAPSSAPVPSPSSASASPLAALPSPSSVPPATMFPTTATPSPDWMGIPERVPTTPFPTIPMPMQPAPNFAFSFGYGACQITRVLNTFDDTLMQQSINTSPITTTFLLTADERNAIYQHMRAINLFAYPTTYTIPLPDTTLRIYTAPHPRYEFTLRNDRLLKTIIWEDAISRPTSDEADQLRDLIAFLKATIDGHAEIQRLPQLIEACA
jgi:hypothetical protein